MSNTEDGIPPQDKKQLGGKILAVWKRYKPILEHDYSRAGYMLSVDSKTYAHAKVIVLYIYVNYHIILLQFIIIKKSNFVIYTFNITTTLNITCKWFEWSGNCTVTNNKRNWVKILNSFVLSMRYSVPRQVHSKHHTYGKVLPSNMENYICGTICTQIHSPRSWEWLVAEWHQKFLASDLLKEIGRTTSMPNMIRGHV